MNLVKDVARESAADALSRHWDGELPVNPVAIAQALGIEVSFAQFADQLSGAIVADSNKVEILLAEGDSLPRQLFTCAHELGHYFERKQAQDAEYSFEESSEEGYEAGRGGAWDLHEFYADEFAGNLLMPAKQFVNLFNQGVAIGELADVFAVTRSAVQSRVRRLRKDGLLPARTF